MASVLIVGGGQGGLQTAITLRDMQYGSPVTIVGAEDSLPYQRPPLSKTYLSGETHPDELLLRNHAYLEARGVDYVGGERIAYVDLDEGIALSVTGREFRFQRLVLATGARARRLAVPGAELRGVVGLNDAKDAQALAALLPAAQRVVVVGGGYLGLEAAASCQRLGKSVTVVEAAPRLLGRVVAPVVADFFRDAHVRRGTQIRLSSEVVQFEGRNGAVERVVLSDGSVLPADVVIVSIGVEPRTELAEHLGLRTIDGAVLVDSYAVTSDPRVLAVGDCTATPNPLREEERVRIPSVQNAVDQGKVAAATLAGTPVAYRAVPWFWSDQYDLKLRIAGLSAGFDDLVVRGEPASEKFAAFYFRGDRLIAADFINRPGEFMLVKRWLAQGFNGHQDLIGDAHVPLTDERLKSSPALS